MRARDRKLRIGDAERETAIALLGEHLTSGRLDLVEYDERCARVVAARSGDDLDALFRDLPDTTPASGATWAPGRRPARTRPRAEVLLGLGGAALLLVLVVVTRDLWLLGFLAIFLIAWVARRR
ncbi:MULTISPECIES: DUF1707 domain-containing protein [Saccharopolyspora]|uniref:DUF1707 domain-containing protein n=1 Tax=Saccharopolyspora gregorii TaxID=33914 RepID=A0ABP6RXE3_9PSEU|nr:MULTISPECIES: DUF1707 domain-containing protein [Saccharopolyspora]MCA1193913.1 DUF1707 domain-containing protein [Saccharopolyspora sp. 6V]MCA1229263.1 DUF1707 domain-containing protein [Saccharopolyspora sp. 6M]MCA1283441.1 DUF1707 domain-containing protein [Saccharopolyspora sp. 7B]